MPQTIDLSTNGGEQTDRLRRDLCEQDHAVGPALQTRDAFSLVVCSAGELCWLPEHETRFGKEPAAKFDERGGVIFNSATYEEAHCCGGWRTSGGTAG